MEGIEPFELHAREVSVNLLKPEFTTAQIQRDLQLGLETYVVSGEEIERVAFIDAHEPTRLAARISNRSETETYRIVRPPDMPARWRNSSFFYVSGTSAPSAAYKWNRHSSRSAESQSDYDWRPDVIELPPGETALVMLGNAHSKVRMQEHQSVAFKGYYHFYARPVGRKDSFDPAQLGTMRHVPPFRLEAAERNIPIRTRFRAKLRRLVPINEAQPYELRKKMSLVVTNIGDVPAELCSPERPLKLKGLTVRDSDYLPRQPECEASITLAPGESIDLFSTRSFGDLEYRAYHRESRSGEVQEIAILDRVGWGEALRCVL